MSSFLSAVLTQLDCGIIPPNLPLRQVRGIVFRTIKGRLISRLSHFCSSHLLVIVAYGGLLTLLISAVAAMELISREWSEVLKMLTEPYSAFSNLSFQWPLSSRPKSKGYLQPLLKKTHGLSWNLLEISLCDTYPKTLLQKSRISSSSLTLRFLVFCWNKQRNLFLQNIHSTEDRCSFNIPLFFTLFQLQIKAVKQLLWALNLFIPLYTLTSVHIHSQEKFLHYILVGSVQSFQSGAGRLLSPTS